MKRRQFIELMGGAASGAARNKVACMEKSGTENLFRASFEPALFRPSKASFHWL
jgi:hypothetical protein